MVGNKADCFEEEEVDEKEAKQFAKDNGIMFLKTSALAGIGIEKLFYDIGFQILDSLNKKDQNGQNEVANHIRDIMNNRKASKTLDDSIEDTPTKKGGCCSSKNKNEKNGKNEE